MHTRRELRRALQAFTEGLIEGHIATDIIITISGLGGPCVGSVSHLRRARSLHTVQVASPGPSLRERRGAALTVRWNRIRACQVGESNSSTQIVDLASSCLMRAAPMFLCMSTTSRPPA